MLPIWLIAVLCFGVNFALWGAVGALRIADAQLDRLRSRPRSPGSPTHRAIRAKALRSAVEEGASRVEPANRGVLVTRRPPTLMTVNDVAVLMAAHNEEVVIDDSLAAITALVPAANVHVVSDFSTDRTVELALERGVNVIETPTNVGKAGALELGISEFRLTERYGAVLLLDADTRLDPAYFRAALPLLDDPRVVAVAGCAHSDWKRSGTSLMARMLTAHRGRIYSVTQRLLKFGQTWRLVNATHIVPGFASLYRTSILPEITINPKGLVIEDFNMTFEVYAKKLGRVGFTLAAKAVTQDPDTLRDYVRQTKRWALGLWQTVRRHRLRPNLLSAVVSLLLLELLSASLVFLVLPPVVLILALPMIVPDVLQLPAAADVYTVVASHVSLRAVLYGVLVPDYLLTCLVAAAERRWQYLVYGLGFVAMRTIDAGIALYSLPRAWLERSNGQWKSPARRAPIGDVVIDLRDIPHAVASGAPGMAGEDPEQPSVAV